MTCQKKAFKFLAIVKDKHGIEHSSECFAARPKWDDVYANYPLYNKGTINEQIQPANAVFGLVGYGPNIARNAGFDDLNVSVNTASHDLASESASAIRISIALIKSGMKDAFRMAKHSMGNIVQDPFLRGSKFFANVKELKDCLYNDNVWGHADRKFNINNDENKAEMIEEMCGRCGVVIIERNGISNYASLWNLNRVIGGNIINGDTVYFWKLYNRFDNYSNGNINMVAVEGFKIINEASKYLGCEIGLSIVRNHDGLFCLDGLNIGNADVVTPGRIKDGNIAVAFIHTHVASEVTTIGHRENSEFFSGMDLVTASRLGNFVYMKHINIDNIFKADPLPRLQNNQLVHDLSECLISDCHQKRTCYSSPTADGSNCQEAHEDILAFIEENKNTNDASTRMRVNKFNQLSQINYRNITNRCFFGIMKKYGVVVHNVNPSSGTEDRL